MNKTEISHRTIFFIAIFIAALWFVVQIRDILLLLFISFVLMSGLRPMVDGLERIKIPRGLAIIIVYIVLFAVFGLIGGIFVPPFIAETVHFVTQFSSSLNETIPFLELRMQDIIPQIAPLSQNIYRVTLGVFSNIVTLFTLLIFTFYLLLERKHLAQFLKSLVGDAAGTRIQQTIVRIETRLGKWIRGQLTLMLIIGVAVYIGLTVLRIPFALPLAIIAGILEVIPNIGPTISAIPAIIVALTISVNPFLALAVGSLYFIIQQIENSMVVPIIMKKAVGLPPLVTIVSLLIGGRLAGIVGVLFSIPFVLIVQILVQEFWLQKAKK